MRVLLESLGCRLNSGEMESLARDLATRGHNVVQAGEDADLCLLNTCTVTAMASRKSRQLLRQLRRAHPDAVLVATGCDAEISRQRLEDMGLDLVVGNRDKDRLAELLTDRGLLDEPAGSATGPCPSTSRTRAFVKVQDGCDNRCTFCVVTLARGAGRSREATAVADEVRRLETSGYREVVISGVHLGSWGRDLRPRRRLADLVRHLLETTSIERLRLSSVEPWDLGSELLAVFGDPRVQPHLHLPLQSGCDATLERMARKTSRAEFSAVVQQARQQIPGVAISTDVIVGFPGEDEAEFEQSVELVEALEFSRLHVFRYSRREGTRAAEMPQQVPKAVAAERSRRMLEIGVRSEGAFLRSQVGQTEPVLWETADARGSKLRWSGLTPRYARVATETPAEVDLVNRIEPTRLLAVGADGLCGALERPPLPIR